MTDCDTLLYARWIVPVVTRDAVLEDHAIAITDGRVIAVLPAEKATQRYQAKNLRMLETHAVT
ncbi:MAG: hypothetical protein ACRECQ_02910, partial [Burkholderiaceae bacterium]